MSTHVRSLLNDTITSWLRFLISALVAFFLTPIMIKGLGVEDFGLWTLLFTVLGFFEMLDFGFYNAAIKYVSKTDAESDPEKQNEMMSTLFFAYLFLALGGTLLAGVLAFYFNGLFSIPEDQQSEALTALAILAARSLLFGLPLSLFRGFLFGMRKIVLSNGIAAFTTILYFFAAWAVISGGGGIVWLAMVNLGQLLLEHLLYLACSYFFHPSLQIAWSRVNSGFIREASSFSIMQFLGNASSMITLKADPLIIQLFLSLSFVALYAVPMKVILYLYILVKQFINVLGPLIVRWHTLKKDEEVRLLFLRSLKVLGAMGGMIVAGGSLLAADFLQVWVGEAFLPASTAFIILLISLGVNLVQLMSCQVLAMADRHVRLIPIFLATAFVNVLLSVLLIHPFGINGVAAATLISAVAGSVLSYLPIRERYRVSLPDMAFSGLVPAVFPALLMAGTILLLKHWAAIAGFGQFFLVLGAGMLVYGGVYWGYSLSREERGALLHAIKKG